MSRMAQATSSGISRVICTAMMMIDCFSVQFLKCLLQLMNFLFCKREGLMKFCEQRRWVFTARR